MCISINRSCVSNYFRYHWYTHKYVYYSYKHVCIHTCVSLSIEAVYLAVYLIILDIIGTHTNMYTIPINMCVYIHVYLYQ